MADIITFIGKVEVDVLPQNLKFLLRATAKSKFPDLYFSPTHPLIKNAPETIGRALFGIPGFAGLYRQKILSPKEVEIFIEAARGRIIYAPEDLEKVKELLVKSLEELEKAQVIKIIEGGIK